MASDRELVINAKEVILPSEQSLPKIFPAARALAIGQESVPLKQATSMSAHCMPR